MWLQFVHSEDGSRASQPLHACAIMAAVAFALQPTSAMSMNGDILIGVDIGGTFTDVVVRRPGAPARIMKIPSTRKDPSLAVLQALERMQADWGLRPQQVIRFVHGTTVATNAVLERKGSCVGLITTEGFRDVLEIGRQMRHQMYDLALDPETPTLPGARPLPSRGTRARQRQRRSRARARRGRRCRRRRRADRGRRAGDRRRVSVLVSQ